MLKQFITKGVEIRTSKDELKDYTIEKFIIESIDRALEFNSDHYYLIIDDETYSMVEEYFTKIGKDTFYRHNHPYNKKITKLIQVFVVKSDVVILDTIKGDVL